MKKVIISVTNDLITDNRVHKIASSLQKMGFNILLVGIQLPNSQAINKRSYETHRIKLLFKTGPLFYAEFNFRLFLFLLFQKTNILLANDLDSLSANFIAAKIKKKSLVYDSHEYFTQIPELIKRPKVQAVWERIEQTILPNIKYAYTVCDSIASIYHEKYGTPFKVVRNIPLKSEKVNIPSSMKLSINGCKIILYQGALNIGRGLQHAIEAMQYIEKVHLVIAGDGDISNQLKQLTAKLNVTDRITFLGKIPLEKMKFITAQADLGLSIEEDLGLNYRFALPNKLFDYIQQQVPVLVSNLPEMVKIVTEYQVGLTLTNHKPQHIAAQFQIALFDEEKRKNWKTNLKIAAHELCWENEEKILVNIFEELY